MYKILEKTQFSEKVFKFRIEAPAIAKHAHAGQFLMRTRQQTGERVPFTLAGWNGDEGWVEFIFMVIGKTTEMLSTYEAGESLRDVVPLGVPTGMRPRPAPSLAAAWPRQMPSRSPSTWSRPATRCTPSSASRQGPPAHGGPSSASSWTDHIHITTDDGSYGEQGVVTAPLERLLQDKAVSQVFCVGPVPMMKFSTLTAQKYDTPITASLNPIMVDGTGLCGCCRVEVGGVTKFACVDGPDFDATLVDLDDLRARQAAYRSEEGASLKAYEEKSCACH